MKTVASALLSAGLLLGCSEKVHRVEATLTGDAGKYQGFPVCIEVSYQNEKSLAIYPENLCSAETVIGAFEVSLAAQADDLEFDVFNSSGDVFLRANTMEIAGVVSSRSEVEDGDTMKIAVTVAF